MSESHFSKTYTEARRRFIDAATAAGATLKSYRIDTQSQEDLTIDVAIIGPDTAPTVVTSSGVHGVEGFFGSATQHALLDNLRQAKSQNHIRHVLIHGVNPFGFSHFRRANEDNIDLNRNFIPKGNKYEGAPDGYKRLNHILNPTSPPSRLESFKLRALWMICRHGLQPLKQAIAGGQYKYPRGIFFGGHGPSKSHQVICENCEDWMGSSNKIVHIDFHTGLGAFGTYKLLLTEFEKPEAFPWYTNAFGSDCVEPPDIPDPTAYRVSGMFGGLLQQHFADREYRFLLAEFGTYGVIRVLKAIRAENRAYHYGVENSTTYQSAKKEFLECFCPNDVLWRRQVVASGLKVIAQATHAISGHKDK